MLSKHLLLLTLVVNVLSDDRDNEKIPENPGLLSQGRGWPETTLMYPPSGILIDGVGKEANITFQVSGDPAAREKIWYKDGKELTMFNNMNVVESGSIISLKFNSLSKVNEGVYHLVVKESRNTYEHEASKSLEVRLKVSYLDDFRDTNTVQTVTARVGEFARLECRPPAHFGAYPQFSWTKGGYEIVESDTVYVSQFGDLVIMQVGAQHYSSDYRCTIRIDGLLEGHQEKQGPSVSLVVTDNPSSYIPPVIAIKPINPRLDAQVKDTYRVECAVNGYPSLPTIRWYRNGMEITSSGPLFDLQNRNYLKITIPYKGDVGGTYRCEANDGATQVYASAYIDIETKPRITVGLPDTEVKILSDSTLSLSCDATSTPSPEYTWYRNAQRLSSDMFNGGNLTVSNINALNKGVYQCEAFNNVGSTISTGVVRVQERLVIVIRPRDVEAFLGTTVTFNCQGKGDPAPTSLRWEFNGGAPPSSHEYTNNLVNQATYVIPKVTSSDKNGKVTCIISSPENLQPEDTASALLTVVEGPQVTATQKNITAVEGNARTLTCIAENVGSSVSWKWLFKNIPVTQDDAGRITVHKNMMLIRALTEADQGIYTCQADSNGLSGHDTMFLRVHTRPRITLEATIQIRQGADARLTCNVAANPKATITWIREGETLSNSTKFAIYQPDHSTSTLVVMAVDKANDSGKYVCQASNEVATVKKEAELVVVESVKPTGSAIYYTGPWGRWARSYSTCPNGGFAIRFRLKVHGNHQSRDYTGLNGICLQCSNGGEVCSTVGHVGHWASSGTCSTGFNGADFKRERKQGWFGDDSSANDLKLVCSNGESYYTSNGGNRGSWVGRKYCPAGQVICGIMTKVSPSQGWGDDTALNGVRLQCCH